MQSNSPAEAFREMTNKGYVYAPGVYSAVGARMAEITGNHAVYMSGGSTNIGMYGFFDGLIGLSEMVTNAKNIVNATDLPVIADADTGYGGVNNVKRTVREFAQANVAAIHIEDQVWPKRCGHAAGKEIVSRADAEARYRAAVDARDELEDDLFLIARTDAYGSANGDWDEHVERGRLYLDAGVDMVWPEMPDPSREDAINYAEEIHETHPDAKLGLNYSSNFKWTEEDDPLTFEELGDIGYKYMKVTLYEMHAMAYAAYEHFKNLAENEEQGQWRMEEVCEDHEHFGESTNVFWELGQFEEYQRNEEKYLQNAEEKYGSSEGYRFDTN